jgi:phenylalanyl-tRNA synthetase beta chain
MFVSLSWLTTHLDLSGLDTPAIADLLTFAGVEVEGVVERGVASDLVVIAEVRAADPHPAADRLKVCKVDIGDGRLRQIVCGATNYQVGDKVPLALPGAVLPGGMEIKAGQLRGVESGGMMCSGRELGLGDDHSGLMILDPAAPLGRPLRAVVASDTVLEVEVTPNRADLLSHFGMARELAALTGRPLRPLAVPVVAEAPAAESLVSLRMPATCPYYTARVVRGVKVGPSPGWLRERLESIGLRPINNVVDITNFVLHETGHPLHAFDLAKLSGGRIIVRPAAAAEEFHALDGKTYRLDPDDCVIADAGRPVALAGVMGGEQSGVTESTTDLLLESAWFAPAAIRRSSRRHGLASDSSYRFERGADPQAAAAASALAIRLILELAGGTAGPVLQVAGSAPSPTGEVALDAAHAQAFLGGRIEPARQREILLALGLTETAPGCWQVPTFRADLQRPIDLIEEIARVAGLDQVPARLVAVPAAPSAADALHDFTRGLKSLLAGLGLFEARTLKLISRAQLADVPISDPAVVPLKNPLSEDHAVMRPSALPGLLATAARNRGQGAARLAFFETGTVFSGRPDGPATEAQTLAILLGGSAGECSWAAPEPGGFVFADLRALLDRLLPPGSKVKVAAAERPGCILAADCSLGKKHPLGFIGMVAPARARALDCPFPLFVAEFDLEAILAAHRGRATRFEELPKFPAVSRDIAVELPLDLPASRIEAALGNLALPLLEAWALFDVFTDPGGAKLAADRKSLAWTLTYRDRTRTLRSEEVDAAHAKVREALAKLQGVKLRS